MSNNDDLDDIDLFGDTPDYSDSDSDSDDLGGLDELAEMSNDDTESSANTDSVEVTPNIEKTTVKTSAVDDVNEARRIVNDFFFTTGIKITEDDPLILMMLHNASLLRTTQNELVGALKTTHGELLLSIQDKHNDGLKGFNERINYLERLLAKLEGQKESIIQDVWSKSQDIMYERTKTTMQKAINEMVKDSQGAVNNQRNILIGAVGGLFIGVVLALIIISLT